MPITTWSIAQLKMSVPVNGTYLPFTSTPDLMQRFVRPALFSTRTVGTAPMSQSQTCEPAGALSSH